MYMPCWWQNVSSFVASCIGELLAQTLELELHAGASLCAACWPEKKSIHLGSPLHLHRCACRQAWMHAKVLSINAPPVTYRKLLLIIQASQLAHCPSCSPGKQASLSVMGCTATVFGKGNDSQTLQLLTSECIWCWRVTELP